MAKEPTNFTAPSATALTELYYATERTGAGKIQVFGVQSIPAVITPKEDITYRTLESDVEKAVQGVRPYETIEIEAIWYTEQFKAIKELADKGDELWWFVKLPDSLKTVVSWRGSVDISLSEVAMDDMVKTKIKIGKSSDPEILDGLPTGA